MEFASFPKVPAVAGSIAALLLVLGYCVYHSVEPGPPYPGSHCVDCNTTSYNWTLPVTTGTDYFAIKTVGHDGKELDLSEEF